jgi:epsilon-lactone hydrolase
MEGILMAGHAHMKVIAVDYRMPPDFPYPAAIKEGLPLPAAIALVHPGTLGH